MRNQSLVKNITLSTIAITFGLSFSSVFSFAANASELKTNRIENYNLELKGSLSSDFGYCYMVSHQDDSESEKFEIISNDNLKTNYHSELAPVRSNSENLRLEKSLNNNLIFCDRN
ncbi:MAG: hypothetical protein QNJ54_05830 [Prochloraceae cyanobacterium]|nr:hypothetical protein [Prochloraceae cyanobacterium]